MSETSTYSHCPRCGKTLGTSVGCYACGWPNYDTVWDVRPVYEELSRLRAEVERLKFPRPEVRWFAEKMEERLRAYDHKVGWRGNDYKVGWADMNLCDLLERLDGELGELDRYQTIEGAARVAIIAMMIADNLRAALGDKSTLKPAASELLQGLEKGEK